MELEMKRKEQNDIKQETVEQDKKWSQESQIPNETSTEALEKMRKDLERKQEEIEVAMRLLIEEKQQLQENKMTLHPEHLDLLMKEFNIKRDDAKTALRDKKEAKLDVTTHDEKQDEKEEDFQSGMKTALDLEYAWEDIKEQRHQLSLRNKTLDMDKVKLQEQQEQMEAEQKQDKSSFML
ncbi:hypothetical protein WMY93_016896 [Mugilogobius chulae]|uniref:Uncharacterized protein n=1 Tax=Mugilogobius chulae TaxID=88201 RepID=A0AAW0NR03_9GOBI